MKFTKKISLYLFTLLITIHPQISAAIEGYFAHYHSKKNETSNELHVEDHSLEGISSAGNPKPFPFTGLPIEKTTQKHSQLSRSSRTINHSRQNVRNTITDIIRKYFSNKARMDSALIALENLGKLAGQRKIIMEFDLDNTFFQYPGDFGIPLSLITVSNQIQQDFFLQFDQFLKNHPQFVLIYNTARNFLSDEAYIQDQKLQIEQKNQNVNIRATTNIKGVEMMRLHFRKRGFTLGIPSPHVLITSGGAHIQFNSTPNTDDINTDLAAWLKADISESNLLHRFNRNLYSIHGSKQCATWLIDSIAGIPVNLDWFSDNSSPFISVMSDDGFQLHVQNTTISKDLGSRIALTEYLQTISATDTENRPWIFFFGDEVSDIPMMNPEKGLRSMSILSAIQVQRTESRLRIAVPWLIESEAVAAAWRMSVFPRGKKNKIEREYRRRAPLALKAIRHQKMQQADFPGLAGLLMKAALPTPPAPGDLVQ